MINIKINDDGCDDIAYVLPHDLMANRKIIYLGGNMETLKTRIKNDMRYKIPMKYREATAPTEFMYNEDMEQIISHETIHIAIWKLTKDLHTTRTLDNIDNLTNRLMIVDIEQ